MSLSQKEEAVLSSSRRISALLPQSRSILDEEERDGDHNDCHKPQQGTGPARVKSIKHLLGEEWESGAEDGAHDRVG